MSKIVCIKIIHTIIWVFFNVVIFYLYYAVIINKIDKWVWLCISGIFLEGLVLLVFKGKCPITIIAEKYTEPISDNFDIFLHNWLARYTKLIYSTLSAIVIG